MMHVHLDVIQYGQISNSDGNGEELRDEIQSQSQS